MRNPQTDPRLERTLDLGRRLRCCYGTSTRNPCPNVLRRLALATLKDNANKDKLFEITRVGTAPASHLTLQGYFAIAIRRNLSNISQSDFGCVAMDDVQRWAVRRGEVLAGAALTGSGWSFYRDMREHWQRQAVTSGDHFQLAIHAIQSDATNSSIWRRQKLHTTRVTSSYALDGAEPGPWGENFCTISRYSDIQVVSSGHSACTLAIVTKQMSALHCPSWGETVSLVNGVLADVDHCSTYLYESDAGRDEVAVRKYLAHTLSTVPNVLFVHGNCLHHQCAIVDLGEFQLIDAYLLKAGKKYKYFSTMAKVVNCWREQAQPMFQAWRDMFGDADALKCAKVLPPKCIAGRWGSGSATEEWMERVGQRKLVAVAELCWAAKKDREKAKAAAVQAPPMAIQDDPARGDAGPVDEMNLESTAQHRETMSRWKRESISAIKDPAFWVTLAVGHRARAPLDHFRNFLDQTYSEEALDEKGAAVARLATRDAERIFRGFDVALEDKTWWGTVLIGAEDADRPWLWEMVLALLLHNAGEFHRRIVAPITRHASHTSYPCAVRLANGMRMHACLCTFACAVCVCVCTARLLLRRNCRNLLS